jgi:hypothetical protein
VVLLVGGRVDSRDVGPLPFWSASLSSRSVLKAVSAPINGDKIATTGKVTDEVNVASCVTKGPTGEEGDKTTLDAGRDMSAIRPVKSGEMGYCSGTLANVSWLASSLSTSSSSSSSDSSWASSEESSSFALFAPWSS